MDKGTDSVLVTPTASNKNYQVRTYVGETEYKRTAMVPTVDGTTITVKCGDPSWPNMNHDNEPAQVYTVNVKVKSDDKPVTPGQHQGAGSGAGRRRMAAPAHGERAYRR